MQYQFLNEIKEKRNMPEEEICFQIKQRRELIDQMVGTLYPSILQNEIDELEYFHRNGKFQGDQDYSI